MTNDPKVGATARATITVEIGGLGSWGPECTVAQVHAQAKDAAIGALWRLRESAKNGGVRIVGEPVITMIVVPE